MELEDNETWVTSIKKGDPVLLMFDDGTLSGTVSKTGPHLLGFQVVESDDLLDGDPPVFGDASGYTAL